MDSTNKARPLWIILKRDPEFGDQIWKICFDYRRIGPQEIL